MSNKKIILHGNDPWDLPGDTKEQALRYALLYCISRSISYKQLSDYLGVSLAEIQKQVFSLKKNDFIELVNGKYIIKNSIIKHINNKNYGEIYDAVIPHIKSEYFRIDDVGNFGGFGTGLSYAVRYIVNHKRFMWDEHGNRTWVDKKIADWNRFSWGHSCQWTRIAPITESKESIIEKIIDAFNLMHENYYRRDHPVIIKKEPILSYSI